MTPEKKELTVEAVDNIEGIDHSYREAVAALEEAGLGRLAAAIDTARRKIRKALTD